MIWTGRSGKPWAWTAVLRAASKAIMGRITVADRGTKERTVATIGNAATGAYIRRVTRVVPTSKPEGAPMQAQFFDLYRTGMMTAAEFAKTSLENTVRLQQKQLEMVRNI